MTASMQSNPLQFATLTDFWAAYELTDRKRVPALLIDDMQVEYEPYVRGIIPQTKLLVEAFRAAGLPIFWSTWWRFGPFLRGPWLEHEWQCAVQPQQRAWWRRAGGDR